MDVSAPPEDGSSTAARCTSAAEPLIAALAVVGTAARIKTNEEVQATSSRPASPANCGSAGLPLEVAAEAATVVLAVDGMKCKTCTGRVEESLRAVEGVTDVSVSLEDGGSATVRGTAAAEVLIAALAVVGTTARIKTNEEVQATSSCPASPANCGSAGLPLEVAAEAATVVLAVDGMKCKTCTGRVEESLRAVEGVTDVSVSLEDGGSATVRGTAAAEALIAALTVVGTTARIKTNEEQASTAACGSAPTRSSSSCLRRPLARSLSTAPMVTFDIYGLACPACETTLREFLEAQPGVQHATVSQLTNRAEVALRTFGSDAERREAIAHLERAVTEHTVYKITHVEVTQETVLFAYAPSSGRPSAEDVLAWLTRTDGVVAAVVVETGDGARGGSNCSGVFWDCISAACVPMNRGGASVLADPAAMEAGGDAAAPLRVLLRVTFDRRRVGLGALVARAAQEADAPLGLTDDAQAGIGGEDKGADEYRAWAQRFAWATVLGAPVIAVFLLQTFVESAHPYLHVDVWSGITRSAMIMWIFTTLVMLGPGRVFHVAAWGALRHGQLNMEVLVSLSTWASYLFSAVSVAEEIVSNHLHGDPRHVHPHHDPRTYGAQDAQFFEAAAMLVIFISLGNMLKASAKRHTSDALRSLMALVPMEAIVCEPPKMPGGADAVQAPQPAQTQDSAVDGTWTERTVRAALLDRDQVVKVLPGASVPADGLVIQGESMVDEAMITGESRPRAKAPPARDDKDAGARDASRTHVFCGTINVGSAPLFLRVLGVGKEMGIARIVDQIVDAQRSRPRIQEVGDAVARAFVPVVLLAACTTWAVWLTFAARHKLPGVFYEQEPSPSELMFAFKFGVAVLVVACPCAVGLATPTALLVGTGVASTHGILIKDGSVLEACGRLRSVLFDKTGTLTEGRPEVTDYVPLESGQIHMADVWRMVAAAEANSDHPVARALRRCASSLGPPAVQGRGLCPDVADFWNHVGQGLSCTVDGHRVLIGNAALLHAKGVSLSSTDTAAQVGLAQQGKTAVFCAVDGVPEAVIAVADRALPSARALVAELRRTGIQVAMVSGDEEATARAVARDLGIDRVYAKALPQRKQEIVQEARLNWGGSVGMVGDGINDAPALKAADVGIAIGYGAEVAIDAADVVLRREHAIVDVLVAQRLSRAVLRRIKLNFLWAMGYNIFGIPAAAGVFYPTFGFRLKPSIAGLAMVCSSLLVIVSSLHLRTFAKDIRRIRQNVGGEGAVEQQVPRLATGAAAPATAFLNGEGGTHPFRVHDRPLADPAYMVTNDGWLALVQAARASLPPVRSDSAATHML